MFVFFLSGVWNFRFLVGSAVSFLTGKVTPAAVTITMLEKRQALQGKKFRSQQKESRLNLEAEIAKTSAKEKAYAEMSNPSLLQLQQELRGKNKVILFSWIIF